MRGNYAKRPFIGYIPAVQSDDSISFTDCSSDGSMATINALSASFGNSEVTIYYDFTLQEEVSGGRVSLTVYMSGIEILSKTMGLCNLLELADGECPLSAGNYSHKITYPLDYPIPEGITCKGRVSVTDQNGNSLGCVDYVFNSN
ncbi:Phosphatidylglycerol/phosphatidylinositol transfer protein [Oopsacas minuta]|uniref:Phosphatidylglycerol/phosphatidylinositol transfer protein n=1 Tax=Oopsacas minuta TaxID=111878 RepID=A0AAV7K5C3_9METZ|nr:Phosphatidylglycerol/phosphatidylinositol transfer protein [Oopsacas minuta]